MGSFLTPFLSADGRLVFVLTWMRMCRLLAHVRDMEQPLLDWNAFLLFLGLRHFCHERMVDFCQKPFLYLPRLPCDLCLLSLFIDKLNLLFYICWALLGWMFWFWISFDVLLNLVLKHFIVNCACVQGDWSIISFCCCSFIDFGSRRIMAS